MGACLVFKSEFSGLVYYATTQIVHGAKVGTDLCLATERGCLEFTFMFDGMARTSELLQAICIT